ncbi:endodeoxyribonuclease RusA [Cereibacter sphaeroides]|nr:endodeoxyribonuclease RusA [Cereibacter sphaeroides]
MVLAKRKREYRADCAWLAKAACGKLNAQRAELRFTFRPPDRKGRDKDNMIASIKAGIDGLADALGVDDRRFEMDFEIGEPVKNGAVIVEVTPA